MLELSYYPLPNTIIVQFALPAFEEENITAVMVDKWFDPRHIVGEKDHSLPVITTTLEENQYIQLAFYAGHTTNTWLHASVVFYRGKDGIAVFYKSDNINISLLVNP